MTEKVKLGLDITYLYYTKTNCIMATPGCVCCPLMLAMNKSYVSFSYKYEGGSLNHLKDFQICCLRLTEEKTFLFFNPFGIKQKKSLENPLKALTKELFFL